MKDYKEVVTERFDQDSDQKPSIYAPDQPIGIYSRKVLFSGLTRCLNIARKQKGDLSSLSLIDLGCGSGEMLDYLVKQGISGGSAIGFDLSGTRIQMAAKNYPNYEFRVADITEPLPLDATVDFAASFDLFSHLNTEEQLLAGLKNVYHALNSGGLFLWYDIASIDHYNAPDQAQSWGFSKAQMLDLAQKSGFKEIHYDSLFRLFFNRYHSLYRAKSIPHSVLQVLEKIVPGHPGNHLFLFVKE